MNEYIRQDIIRDEFIKGIVRVALVVEKIVEHRRRWACFDFEKTYYNPSKQNL